MAQLSDDCFAHGGGLLSPEAAVDLLSRQVTARAGIEDLALDAADGRVLARDLVAGIDLPPFANVAVDGFAVRHADLVPDAPTTLPAASRIAAGARDVPPLLPGAAARVFTGAMLPDGADTVFMQEDVRLVADGVVLPPGLKRGANTRAAGEDVRRDTVAIPAGTRLTPAHLALAAALGTRTVPVRTRLRVAVLSTGDELHSGTGPLPPGQIFDANRSLLLALSTRAGARITDIGALPDDADTIARTIAEAAAAHDLVLTSGGVSVGEEDHARTAMARSGRVVVWRLAIKPGRPVAMGVVRGTPVLGLPGNPVAAFLTFVLLARPLLAALAGETFVPPLPLPVTAGFAYRKKPGRREFVRVRLERRDGLAVAEKHPRDGAGVLTSLTRTDGLAVLPETVLAIAPGDTIGFLPYATLF